MKMRAFVACCLLAGCAEHYDPPMQGDHDAVKYQSDLVKCQKQVNVPADRINNATVGSSLRSVFKSDDPQRRDIQTCMQGKGYKPQ